MTQMRIMIVLPIFTLPSIKQFLTAVAIRSLIVFFPAAGPALNPMLGTTWAIFSTGKLPDDPAHYFVYWGGPCLGAVVAALVYAIYAGEKFMGKKLPVGPIKKLKTPEPKKASAKKKKN